MSKANKRRLGLVAAVLAMLGVAYAMGVFDHLGEPRALARMLLDMGWWGYGAFLLAYTALQPFGVPGTLFVVAAPLIWPWPTAFALSMLGTMAASVVGFWFARFVARDWVATRIPASVRKYEAALERHGLQTVIILRLILWMPQWLHFFFGVSRVGFWTHFWGSLIGYAPPLLLVSYLGAEMFDASGKLQTKAWPAFAGLVVASLIVAAIARALARRQAAQESARSS